MQKKQRHAGRIGHDRPIYRYLHEHRSATEISPALVANARTDHADANMLATGRKLFVSRCLECHALPPVTKYSKDEWPYLVSRMSGRANVSASEKAAIIAYLRAASAKAR